MKNYVWDGTNGRGVNMMRRQVMRPGISIARTSVLARIMVRVIEKSDGREQWLENLRFWADEVLHDPCVKEVP